MKRFLFKAEKDISFIIVGEFWIEGISEDKAKELFVKSFPGFVISKIKKVK